ncbi:MAG: heavy metal translocating P-type ATPase [Spongiibacteraceae bacterium]
MNMSARASLGVSTESASAIAERTELQPDCYHCGLPVAAGSQWSVMIDGQAQVVCCPACQAVAETIVAGGFTNYYRFRENTFLEANGARPAPIPEFSAFDLPEFTQRWLTTLPDGHVETELLIGGMHCAACVWLLENYLRQLPGVAAVQVSLDEQRALIRWAPDAQKLSAICSAIATIGYQPQPYSSEGVERLRRNEQRDALRRLGVAGIGMMQVGMCAIGLYAGSLQGIEPVYRDFLRWTSLLVSIPILLYSAQTFFIGAWRGVKLRKPGMDVPIALALILAFVASTWATLRGTGEVYFDSVTMFIFLLLGGRYLEMRARHFNGRISTDLLGLLPHTAIRIDSSGGHQVIPLEKLQRGDNVLVSSGQYLPADGVLLDASASINEAALTGEFLPVKKQRGDEVFAGSINGEQALTLHVSGVGQQLRLSAIHTLSRQAQREKPQLALVADRISSHFVTAIVVLAAITYIGWYWLEPARAFWITLSVLVVSCPCALGLATPVAITQGTNALRRAGLLVTQPDVWEKLTDITDIVFDKTGTLSEGRIQITTSITCGTLSIAHCRAIAKALEAGSSHPIAAAFQRTKDIGSAQNLFLKNVVAQERRQLAGAGVEADIAGQRYRIGTPAFAHVLCPHVELAPPAHGQWVLLATVGQPLCWFRLDDQPRADAAATVQTLQQRGLQVHLLSGDHSDAVATLAAQLGIATAIAGASPEFKLEYLQNLQRQGRRVLMVGDGINDIPVLAAADVSIAMNNSSQLAKTTADCIFLNSHLDRLIHLLDAAAATSRIIRQNLTWALAYNAVAIPLAAAGWIPPYLAAIGMSLSSLLVLINASRLQRLSVRDT